MAGARASPSSTSTISGRAPAGSTCPRHRYAPHMLQCGSLPFPPEARRALFSSGPTPLPHRCPPPPRARHRQPPLSPCPPPFRVPHHMFRTTRFFVSAQARSTRLCQTAEAQSSGDGSAATMAGTHHPIIPPAHPTAETTAPPHPCPFHRVASPSRPCPLLRLRGFDYLPPRYPHPCPH